MTSCCIAAQSSARTYYPARGVSGGYGAGRYPDDHRPGEWYLVRTQRSSESVTYQWAGGGLAATPAPDWGAGTCSGKCAAGDANKGQESLKRLEDARAKVPDPSANEAAFSSYV